jgi:cytochrome c550
MKRSAIVPFVAIMVFGIVLMFALSFKGLGDAKQVADEKKNGGKEEKTEQTAGKPEDIYKASCISCHGENYEGGMGPALTGVGDKKSADEIKDILKNGKGAMPGGLVPDDKLDDMTKWLSEL